MRRHASRHAHPRTSHPRTSHPHLRTFLVFVLLFATSSSSGETAAQSSPLLVLSSNGVKAAIEQLAPEIEQAVGRQLAITFGTSRSIVERVSGGEAFDVAILTADAIDDLAKAGAVGSGTRTPLGSSGIGIGVRAGSARPDVGDSNAIKHVLLAARSVTYAADGASRPWITRMLDTLGITDAMKPKTILEQGSVRATGRVVQGDAEMVITLISEIVPVPGIELAGALPEEFQNYVSFAAGIGAKAGNAEAARALLAFLSGPGARPAFTANGITAP